MYISLDWISDYVDLSDFSADEIANRLTLGAAEVESVEKIQRFVKNVIIGKVVDCTRLDEKRTLCTVNCGSKIYKTVCGAPNARIGLIAPFAPVGTELANGVKIEKNDVAGHTSEGILCSAAELGLSHWHEAVFECPPNTEIGKSFADFVPDSDVLIEIDNKSLTHRPDLWGHYGIARELAAIFQRELKPMPLHETSKYVSQNLPKCDVSIEDIENAPCYGCVALDLEGGATLASPIFMQRRLHALGQRTYNLLVDVTNYVNLELAQPTHAFDGDKVAAIRVAKMGQDSKFQTLDGQERQMQSDDLMIWGKLDGSFKPVAIAGIMGGRETEINEGTKKLLLESANFKSGRIRKTSQRLDLRSDSSQRFEKSQPPINVKIGAQRILRLIEESGCPFSVTSQLTIVGDLKEESRTITLPAGRLSQLAGIDIPQQRVSAILESLGFGVSWSAGILPASGDAALQAGCPRSQQELSVSVPPFRSEKDISIPEDIVEEILRIYGYDNIPIVMPQSPLRPLYVDKAIKLEHKARRLLAQSHGFFEVHNYSWMNESWLSKIGYKPDSPLTLRNPAASGDTQMRTSLMPNLLALVPKNRAMRDKFRCFEVGHVWERGLPARILGTQASSLQAGKMPALHNELPRLSGISFQQSGASLQEHYLSVKSAIEDLAKIFGDASFRFVANEETTAPWEAAFHSANVFQGDEQIGTIGVADKALLDAVSPEGGQIVFFELCLDKMKGYVFPKPRFSEPPKFPGSWQDFSLLWQSENGYEQLEKVISPFKHPLLLKREFLTAYQGKGLEKGVASYSFRFWIGAEDHTLCREEIDGFHTSFLEFLKSSSILIR